MGVEGGGGDHIQWRALSCLGHLLLRMDSMVRSPYTAASSTAAPLHCPRDPLATADVDGDVSSGCCPPSAHLRQVWESTSYQPHIVVDDLIDHAFKASAERFQKVRLVIPSSPLLCCVRCFSEHA